MRTSSHGGFLLEVALESSLTARNEKRVYRRPQPPQSTQTMRTGMLSLLAAPLALMGASAPASAYPFSSYSYSSPYSSYMRLNGPGGYSGFGYGTRNFGMFSDNYGTTTCMAVGNSVMCF